jgi:hypothetical protein
MSPQSRQAMAEILGVFIELGSLTIPVGAEFQAGAILSQIGWRLKLSGARGLESFITRMRR